MGGPGHLVVIVAVEFKNCRIGMTNDLHHSPHISIFLITAKHLEFTIAGDEQQGRAVFSYVIQWRHIVEDWLFVIDTPLAANCKVGDGVSTVRNQPGKLIRINVVLGQPAFVQTNHARKIPSS